MFIKKISIFIIFIFSCKAFSISVAPSTELYQSGVFSISLETKVHAKLGMNRLKTYGIHFRNLIEYFEEEVLIKMPSFFTKDLDKAQIQIIFTSGLKPQGVFDGRDFPKTGILKLYFDLALINSKSLYPLAAHELFHALHYRLNPTEEAWVKEGLAQVFEYLITGHLNGINFRAALNNPMTALMGKYNINRVNRAQYGHDMLFFYYLYKHCGGVNLFWQLVSGENGLTGYEAIDETLSKRSAQLHYCRDFKKSALSFELAKAHNQISYQGLEESSQYFLFPTFLTPKFPKFKNHLELDHFLKTMELYSPIKLPAQKFKIESIRCIDCQSYYSQDEFPYLLQKEAPRDLANWQLILLKTL